MYLSKFTELFFKQQVMLHNWIFGGFIVLLRDSKNIEFRVCLIQTPFLIWNRDFRDYEKL